MLEATDTDAFLVCHSGEIVAERYLHGADARTKRLGMSMSKTCTSMLVGVLADRGLLQLSAFSCHFQLISTPISGIKSARLLL